MSPSQMNESNDVAVRNRLLKHKKWRNYIYHENFVKEWPKIKKVLQDFKKPFKNKTKEFSSGPGNFKYFQPVWLETKAMLGRATT